MGVVTLKEASRILGRNYKTVFYHFKQGRIPAERVGGVWLVKAEDVAQALDTWQSPKARNAKPQQ